jgi:large subunit ribosomal protein L1
MKRGKKYRQALEKIDREHRYEPEEAVRLLKELSFAKFDEVRPTWATTT